MTAALETASQGPTSTPNRPGSRLEPAASSCPSQGGAFSRNRFERMLSTTEACISAPDILPGRGTVNESTPSRPAADAPTTTTLSLNVAGSTTGFSPASSCCSA